MVKTKVFKGVIAEPWGRSFLWSAFRHYIDQYVRSLLFRRTLIPKRRRTSMKVKKVFDQERLNRRAGFLETGFDFETYIFGAKDDIDFILLNNAIVYAPLAVAERKVIETIESYLGAYLRAVSGSIIEFGSGDGRNLLWLKKKYPAIRFIGLELSPESVRLAKAAAHHFGLGVEFIEADVLKPLPRLPSDVLTCFSCHALEQMPRVFPAAVESMINTARKEAFFFEPISELYSLDLRGIVSRMRIFMLDRLIGLTAYLREQHYHVVHAARLGYGVNALNETCVVVIKKY